MVELIDAWDSKTGAKLPQRVPENWPRIFSTVSATKPTQKEMEAAAATDSEDVPEADSPGDVASTPKTAPRGRQTTSKEA